MKSEIDIELAFKFLNGEADCEEKEVFSRWLDASEDNRFQFDELQKEWELTGEVYNNYEPDIEAAWGKVKKQTSYKKGFTLKAFYRVSVAAVFLISIGLGIKKYQQSESYYRNNLITYLSENTVKEIKLPDGTIILLNANSRLEAPKSFTSNERKVFLTGEAFFDVTKNPNKPFIIKSKNTITEVLGTSFNINAKENEVVVTVSTGKVSFYYENNKSGKIFLGPGMSGVSDEGKGTITSYNENNINYLGWKTGILKFKDTPLVEVCNTLSNTYNIHIEINSLKAQDYLFTGNFNNAKVDQTLEIIATTLDIEFVKSKNQIQVKFK